MSLRAIAGNTNPLSHAGLSIVNEHVEGSVRVVGNKVRRGRPEADEAPVRTNGGTIARVIALRAIGGDAHALCEACLPILDNTAPDESSLSPQVDTRVPRPDNPAPVVP